MEKIQNKPWNIPPSKEQGFMSRNSAILSAGIAAICIVIYLAAIVQFTIRLYLHVDKSKIAAELEFSQITAIALVSGAQNFMDQVYIDNMNKALSNTTRIEAVIISTQDGEYAFEKQKDYAITWVNNSPRFNNKFIFSNVNYYRPLPIPEVRGLNTSIKAIAIAYDYNDITKILKDTLLIIMIGFAIAFFAMLIQLLIGKKEPENDFSYSKSYDTDKSYDSFNYKTPDESYETSDTGPKGLYSPRSNIGWEDYIMDRLGSELHRCSSSEKDLSFILLEFTDLANDDVYGQSAEEAVADLSSRDLLFEYGRWGVAAILPGISLETAITKSEKFFQRIIEKYPRGYSNSAAINIGLTSRSGRLLNAERLMLEAREALKKASSDPATPIIAFKSDPEKYREFIRTHS